LLLLFPEFNDLSGTRVFAGYIYQNYALIYQKAILFSYMPAQY